MTHTDGLKNVETLINRFGGMRPMARKMNVAVSTIQGWKKRDHIPAERVSEVIAAARTHHVSLADIGIQKPSNDAVSVSDEPEAIIATKPSSDAPVAQPSTNQQQSVSPARPSSRPQGDASMASQKYPTLDAAKIKRDAVKRSVVTTVSIMAVMAGIGYLLFAPEVKQISAVVQDKQAMQQRIQQMETQVTTTQNSLSGQIQNLGASLTSRINQVENQLQSPNGQAIDLGQIASRFENLKDVLNGQGDVSAAMQDMQSMINTLQGRIDDMDQSLEQTKAKNEEMAQALDGVSGRDISAAAMLLTLTQMRESMNRSEPFANDLALLQQMVGDDDPELTAAIARLAPYAENGLLSPKGISDELKGVSGEIIAAKLRGEDVSVEEKIMARLGQILSVKKDGEPVIGIKEQAIIARAQTALDAGDTKTALMELQKLEGDAATTASPITDQLQGAIAADETIGALIQNVMQKMQNPDGLKTMIENLPDEIEKQMQGTYHEDPNSGLKIIQ